MNAATTRDPHRVYRPSPLCRAYSLERELGTPAKIFYKFEGNNTSGSHKLNSALAQAYYAHEQGLSTITTETGTGQWGTALTRGRYAYDFADTGQTCPLCKMYTLGNGFVPSPDHAGGLRYHGMSPIVSKLRHDGHIEAVAVRQTEVFEAAERFARLETILPAPESAHTILVAMREAERCRETGEAKTILFGLTGTGYFDMVAYDRFNRGELEDHVPTDAELEAGLATIPSVPGVQ